MRDFGGTIGVSLRRNGIHHTIIIIFISIFMKKYLLIATFLLGLSTFASAQEGTLGLTANLLLPQGEFQETIDAVGGGISFYGGYQFRGSPLYLGAEIGLANFGTDSRTEPWSSTIPDLKMNVDNNYNLFHGHLVGRVQPQRTAFQPFIEGLVGFNYFFTETTVSSRGGANANEPIASDTNYDDSSLSYGVGAGVQFLVSRFESDGVRGKFYMSLSGRYLRGGEASYLKKGSIEITENSQVIYNPMQSRTDMFLISLGFIVKL